jgi:alpha-methylacyl-CoA racemase
VIDLSRLAPGPYCSMLLGDLGADVVRVDRPGTDAGLLEMLGRNKRSIVLDLKRREAQGVLHRLCAGADVLLEGFRPGVTARLGADYETVSRINPRIVYCSLTGYGQTGPLAQEAGHDIDYIAVAGVLGQLEVGDEPPIPPLNLVADFAGGGLMAAFGIAAALYERERSGRGQYLDAAMIDGSASLMAMHFATAGALSDPRRGVMNGAAPFYRCYRCADGRDVAVGAVEAKFFRALWEGLDLGPVPEQMDRASWPDQRDRIAERFATRTRDEWVVHFHGRDACVAPVLALDEVPKQPHHLARSSFAAGAGGREQVAPAPRFSRTPGGVRRQGGASGAETDAILAEAGCSPEEIRALRAGGSVA